MEEINKEINPETGDKTFTQEEVNRIIGERLSKEKSKAEALLAQREQELLQKELRLTAREKLSEMDLPIDLLDALNLNNMESIDKSLGVIKNAFETYRKKENPPPPSGGSSTEHDPFRDAMGLK